MNEKAVDVGWDGKSMGHVTAKTSIDLTMVIVGNRRKSREDLRSASMANMWFVVGIKTCSS